MTDNELMNHKQEIMRQHTQLVEARARINYLESENKRLEEELKRFKSEAGGQLQNLEKIIQDSQTLIDQIVQGQRSSDALRSRLRKVTDAYETQGRLLNAHLSGDQNIEEYRKAYSAAVLLLDTPDG